MEGIRDVERKGKDEREREMYQSLQVSQICYPDQFIPNCFWLMRTLKKRPETIFRKTTSSLTSKWPLLPKRWRRFKLKNKKPLPRTNFCAVQLCFAKIKHSDWLKEVLKLGTSNQNTLS